MKLKKLFSIIMIFAICFMLTGCEDKRSVFTRFEDFENTTIGVIEGSVHGGYVLSRIEEANIKNYTDHEVMVRDVKKGVIDGCVLDYPVAQYYEEQNSSLAKFPSPLKEEEFCLYVSNSFNYYDEAYDLITRWKKDGELEPLQEKWFSANKAKMKLNMNDYSNYNTSRGTISVVFDKTSIPTSYYDKNGTLQGYEIELVYKIAKELNLKVKITASDDFDGMLDDLRNGKFDIAAGMIAVNDERKQGANFLPSTCEGGTYILTKKNRISVAKKEKPQYVINTLEDLDGKKVGVLAGSMFESFLLANNVLTVNKYYSSQESSVEAVVNEEVAGAIVDKEIAKLSCSRNSNLTYINVGYSEYGTIFPKNEDVLLNQYNKFLQKISMNGTLEKLSKKWSSESYDEKLITDYKTLPNINGVIKLATSFTLEPYAYELDNGLVGGFDIELAIEFCKDYGYALEIVNTSCDNIFELVSSGACNCGAGAITKTLEREAKFRFSDATGKDGIALVILSKNSAYATGSKASYSIGEQFYNVFVANDGWLLLIAGIALTIAVSVISIAFGSVLGMLISFKYLMGGKKYKNAILTLNKISKRTPIFAWLALLAFIGFGGNYDTGIIIGIVVFSIWLAFEGFGLIEKLSSKFTEDAWINGYNLRFDRYTAFLTSVFYGSYDVVFLEYRNSILALINNTTLLGLIYSFDFAYACNYIRMNSLVSWIPILLMFIFYFSINTLAEQLIDRLKISKLAKKRSANDFNFGTVSKFSLEDDSENLFKFNYQTEGNEYSRGLIGPIIKFENVKVDYDGRVGLNDVNVEINKGECVAVVGPAKSGVTTFFKLINGFIEPSDGNVLVFGKDTKVPELKKLIRNGVSVVLRNAFMIPNKNVIENIMIVLTETENMSKRKAYVTAYRLLFKIGLADKAFCYENELSLSEMKRLLLFRGLVFFPEIVILDHIDEGLSKNELVELFSLLKQLKESKVTLLIASDDLEWLQTLTDRMLVFDEGKIIDDGETEKLINRPEKQKTIEFVSKSLLFHTTVTSKLFDHVQITGKIWEFAKNNELSQEIVDKLVEIIELIEKEVIVKVMPSTFKLDMRMIYEKPLNQVKLNIEYDGNDFDYINSMSVDKYDVFARLVESIHYSYDGINKYDIIIPLKK